MTHPSSAAQHILALQECTFRKVWEDDGNVQRVEVEQSATAFFKTIYTRMHVVQVPAPFCCNYSPLRADPDLEESMSSNALSSARTLALYSALQEQAAQCCTAPC